MTKNIFDDLGKTIKKGFEKIGHDLAKGAKDAADFTKDTINKGVDGVKDVAGKIKDTHDKVCFPEDDDEGPELAYEVQEAPLIIDVEKYLGPRSGWDKNPEAAEQEKAAREKERNDIETAEKVVGMAFGLVRDASFAFPGKHAVPVSWVGIDIGEFIIGKIFNAYKPEEETPPNPYLLLFQNLTTFYKDFITSNQLKKDMAVVASVYEAIQTYIDQCKGQDHRSVLHELNRPEGILAQLNKIKMDPDTQLKILLNRLLADEDLEEKKKKAYESKSEYETAYTKLLILSHAIGALLLAIKTLIVFENTSQSLKGESPYSLDFSHLQKETQKWKDILAEKVANVKQRRLASVVDTHGRLDYLVFIRSNLKSENFKNYLDESQPKNNIVRNYEGHIAVTKREVFVRNRTPFADQSGSSAMKRKVVVEFVVDDVKRRNIKKKYLSFHKRDRVRTPGWAYDGFKDMAADHDDTVFCYMQDCDRMGCHMPLPKSDDTKWYSRRRTANLYKSGYNAGLKKYLDKRYASFDELIKTWEQTALHYKYQMALPIIPPSSMQLVSWESSAPENTLWADSSTEVRYGVCYKNDTGESVEVSWTDWEPTAGKAQPKLENIPCKIGDFGSLPVKAIKIYRQFRTSPNAQTIDSNGELLAILVRDAENNDFPSFYIDTKMELKKAIVFSEKALATL